MPTDHNSLLYWYLEVREYFETPNTFTLSPPDLLEWMDGMPENWVKKIKAELKGKYPVFFRTDLASNKHEYNRSCIIHNEREIKSKIYNTLDFNFSVDLFPQHLVFRELLTPFSNFKAFDGLPIARELRVFVEKGKVTCVHRYWAHEVFVRDHWASFTIPDDWEKRWTKLYDIPKGEIIQIIGQIENDFSPALKEENWSVDFMYAYRGHSKSYRWFLIDMAQAEMSFHPEHSSDLIELNSMREVSE
ncbi:MAG: hypothetical protein AMDU3_IPLC00004G0027 [Thermoplasmatales archaeon I-plasma]|nr:MAG: hypothetical protein AMDU3_IPLC00004G0027 [Thermoplasmatales archaeon I-plasma]